MFVERATRPDGTRNHQPVQFIRFRRMHGNELGDCRACATFVRKARLQLLTSEARTRELRSRNSEALTVSERTTDQTLCSREKRKTTYRVMDAYRTDSMAAVPSYRS